VKGFTMSTTRRWMIGALVASGAMVSGATAAPAMLDLAEIKKETDLAALYHCDFGDPQRFSAMLQNMGNHYAAYEFDPFRLKLVVVAHAAGIKFFLEDRAGTPWANETIDPDIWQRFVSLSKFGVEAYLCRFTFHKFAVDPEKARKHASLKFVPSGVATVAELQTKGFAYLKVG